MIGSSQHDAARLVRRLPQGFTTVEALVALLIFGMVCSGILWGYVQANRIAEWSSMSLGAQSYASQGIEQARAAKWDTAANGQVIADLLPPVSFSHPTNLMFIDTNDVPQSGAPLLVTNYLSVSWVAGWTNGPYLRQIRSDVVWAFPLTGKTYTNTIITYRAPDQ